MAQLNFNAATVAPQEALEALPAGWYAAQIVESEMKPTSNGQGQYLQLTLQIMGGQFNGRKVRDRLNLVNANQTAVEIAYQTLSAICHATNIIQIQDTQQLHGRPMEIKVSVRAAGTGADGKNYEASNEIRGYRAIQQGQQQPMVAPGFQGQPSQAYPQGFGAPTTAPTPTQAPTPFAAPAQAPAPTQPAQAPAQMAAPASAPWGAPVDPNVQQGFAQPAGYPGQPSQNGMNAPQQAPQNAPVQQPWNQQPAGTAMAPGGSTPTQTSAPAPAANAGAPVPPWMQGQQQAQ